MREGRITALAAFFLISTLSLLLSSSAAQAADGPATEEARLALAYDHFFDARRLAKDRRWTDAIGRVDQALALRDEFQDFHFGAASYRLERYRAEGLSETDLVREAVKHFQWIIDHVPGSPFAERSHLGMGMAHQSLAWVAQKDEERDVHITEAFRQYRKARDADPRSPEPYIRLAEANAEFGYDHRAAFDYLLEAEKRAGYDNAAIKAAMGLILLKRRAWADAASAFRDAADRDRENPWYWYQLAFCYFQRASELDAAAQGQPPDSRPVKRAARTRKGAERYLSRALRVDPKANFLSALKRRGRVDEAFVSLVRERQNPKKE